MRFAIVVVPLVTFLAACQTQFAGNEDSPYYLPPAGSHVVLNQAVTVPPNEVGVFIQGGKVVARGQVRYSEPHCKLELRRLATAARTIAPDDVLVTRVSRELGHSVDTATVQLADAARALGVSSDRDDMPSIRAFATYLYLGSDRQPEVYRLGCGVWDIPNEGRHLSINEMRRTLGDIASLRLPGP